MYGSKLLTKSQKKRELKSSLYISTYPVLINTWSVFKTLPTNRSFGH